MASKKKRRLVFVDTVNLIDFYEQEPKVAAETIGKLARHPDSLIVTCQVQMEFLKRRLVTLSAKQIEAPKGLSPVYGKDHLKKWNAKIAEVNKLRREIQKTMEGMLADPEKHDPIYKGVMALHALKNDRNLREDSLEYESIVNSARTRFELGKPPRKSTDTSFGDAVNWEWIISRAIAAAEGTTVTIVSRDHDYGLDFNKSAVMNDFLLDEFRRRAGAGKSVELVRKITDALERLDENVTEGEKAAEEQIDMRRRLVEALIRQGWDETRRFGLGDHLHHYAMARQVGPEGFYYPGVPDDLDQLAERHTESIRNPLSVTPVAPEKKNDDEGR